MKSSLAAKRLRRRIVRHHIPLALGSGVALFILAGAVGGDASAYRWSMATAYVSTTLLVVTLSLGPLLTIRRSRTPTSFDLRRDVGIWAGLVGLGHAVVGSFVHLGNPLLYVFRHDAYPARLVLRTDTFGFANYTGLTAAAILLLLLATSNDAALKRLGRERWKSTQRWAYGLLALTVAHAATYQVLENRRWLYVALFAGLVLTVSVLQGLGVLKRRQKARAA